MGSKVTWEGVENAYRAAEHWVDQGLRSDGSLFTPGAAIWTREFLGELHNRFLDCPDYGNRDFLAKLKDQMAGSPPEVLQLMGEVLYVHFIMLDRNEEAVRTVLEWSANAVDIPPQLSAGLQFLFVNPGAGRTRIAYQLGTLIETVEQWKELESNERIDCFKILGDLSTL